MAHRNKEEQLASAWRALSGLADGAGWKVIELSKTVTSLVLAGRRGSGNEESLLVGIADVVPPNDSRLPRGQGFAFHQTEMPHGGGRAWFALVRQQGGPLALFTLMAADLVSLLERFHDDRGEKVLGSLLARIRAWQDFMKREQPAVLSTEEEVGLLGELVVLRNMIADGMLAADAMDSWVGPMDGLHDFSIGTGGVEVKTTTLPAGFTARIGNLDQLDNSLHRPLYIACVRVSQSDGGKTLPEYVDDLARAIQDDAAALLFSGRLFAAGYLEAMRDHYSRRFLTRELVYRLVEDESPRLTRATVPAAVSKVMYTLDLDAFPVVARSFAEISGKLGA